MDSQPPLRRAIRVLVVEDELQYFALIDAMVQDFEPDRFQLVNEPRLASAQTRLQSERFDLLLLDLGLPDGEGLAALDELSRVQALPATIVLTGHADDQTATDAIRRGAQDYLVKSRVDGPVLVRALAYALERDRLHRELEEARLHALQRELVFLRKITDDSAQPNGDLGPILADYGPLLRRYIVAVRAGEPRPAESIETLTVRLANRRARARDVAQMHLTALDQVAIGMNVREQRRLADDARLVLIEILGNLADLYGLTDFGGR